MLQNLWFVEWADYIFLDWFARCYLSMNVWLKLTMDDFVWLLGSFVAHCDIVFDWYPMLRGVSIIQRFFCERWLSFLLWSFGCSQFHGKHRGALLFDRVFRCCKFEQLQVCCKVDLCHYWLLREIVWLFRG